MDLVPILSAVGAVATVITTMAIAIRRLRVEAVKNQLSLEAQRARWELDEDEARAKFRTELMTEMARLREENRTLAGEVWTLKSEMLTAQREVLERDARIRDLTRQIEVLQGQIVLLQPKGIG